MDGCSNAYQWKKEKTSDWLLVCRDIYENINGILKNIYFLEINISWRLEEHIPYFDFSSFAFYDLFYYFIIHCILRFILLFLY